MNGSMSILGRSANGRAIIAPTNSLSTVLDKATDKLVKVIKFRDDNGKIWTSKITKKDAQLATHVFKTNLDMNIELAKSVDLENRRLKVFKRLENPYYN